MFVALKLRNINMKFDPTKPVQTRDGQKVRIICTDVKGTAPILALINNNTYEITCRYTEDGSFYSKDNPSDLDLINIPERVIRYRVICEDGYIGEEVMSIYITDRPFLVC